MHTVVSPFSQPFAGVPPHSPDVERAVLGSILSSSECARVACEMLVDDDFYVPSHRAAFACFKELASKMAIDEVIASAELERRGFADARHFCGVAVDDASPVSLEGQCRILQCFSADRRAIDQGSQLIQAGLRGDGTAALALDLSPIKPSVRRPSELLAFDVSRDERCLFGSRYLCAGGSLLIIGQSGIGKSSLGMQWAIAAALGQPFFGITPTRPLRSIVVQAENDAGDLAEEMQGVIHGMNLQSRVKELDERLTLYDETVLTGAAFARGLRSLALLKKPYLIWIDPLLSFFGADISNQEACSAFLRNQLNPISRETGCTFMILHHTGKPPRESQSNRRNSDYAYLGIGSSELTNWARAIVTLREVGENLYELRAAKRGSRAGLQTAAGHSTHFVHIKHSSKGICWERSLEGANTDNQDEMIQEVLARMGEREMRFTDVLQLIMQTYGCKRTRAYEHFHAIKKHLEKLNGSNLYHKVVREQFATIHPDQFVRSSHTL